MRVRRPQASGPGCALHVPALSRILCVESFHFIFKKKFFFKYFYLFILAVL